MQLQDSVSRQNHNTEFEVLNRIFQVIQFVEQNTLLYCFLWSHNTSTLVPSCHKILTTGTRSSPWSQWQN